MLSITGVYLLSKVVIKMEHRSKICADLEDNLIEKFNKLTQVN